ncbi:co-chaperone GrpE [Halteromyces radiatus]|uniref:co-chaperone GrpE n=1 Tax=Halteromyces radiatus TaxID=101107 RepID=UPI00222108C4|nr:co-chaperone GrpE [Halteromyces radiatus]KAI8099342.1 co-chaperone GrpE [Halteromyces radiatus]
MSFVPLRQVAIRSVRQTFVSSRVSTPFSSIHRTYSATTEKPPSADDADKKPEEATVNTEEQPIEISPEEEFKKQLAEKDKKISELQDAYLRCLADQENIRERSRKETAAAKEFAIQKFAKDLLDTVDILNMALTSVPEPLRSKETAEAEAVKSPVNLADQLSNLYTGVSMTETELVKTLKRHGVEQHNPEGEVFDPNLHQALFQAPMPDKDAGIIFSVQKLGYTLKGRVLRPAQVGVVAEKN